MTFPILQSFFYVFCRPIRTKYHQILHQNSPDKKKQSRSLTLSVRVTHLPGQARYCFAERKCPVDICRQKKTEAEAWYFVFALPSFLGRPTYCRGVGTVRWTVPATISIILCKKKRTKPKLGSLCSRYLAFWVGQCIVLALRNMPVACFSKKKPPTFVGGLVFALPIFPGSHPPSIVGVHELNFCVRDGNRWTLMTINTNSIDGFDHRLC